MGRRIGTLGLVNYRDHPTNRKYKVFSFYTEHEAESFKAELNHRNIWFEYDTEQIRNRYPNLPGAVEFETVHLFGVKDIHFKKAQRANYMVSAKHRKPIIKYRILRYALLAVFFGTLTLGIVGYVKNQQKLKEKTEELQNE
jgi:hypothetical protein